METQTFRFGDCFVFALCKHHHIFIPLIHKNSQVVLQSSQTSSSSSCFIHCERVGGNDPPFGSALGISHRLTINEASPFRHIDSPCCPRMATSSTYQHMSQYYMMICVQFQNHFVSLRKSKFKIGGHVFGSWV